jgi:uncharacterized protein YuzE
MQRRSYPDHHYISFEEKESRKMKVNYDKEVDAVYIELSKSKSDGVIEVAEGINIDVTSDGKIVGIELLDATQKVSLDTLLTYEIAAESAGDWMQAKDKDQPSLI